MENIQWIYNIRVEKFFDGEFSSENFEQTYKEEDIAKNEMRQDLLNTLQDLFKDRNDLTLIIKQDYASIKDNTYGDYYKLYIDKQDIV